MAEEIKDVGRLSWFRTAKDKFRAFAYGQQSEPRERPRVGLALAGGFARRIAHLGVLRVFRGAGISVDCVAGTSVGALVDGFVTSPVPVEGVLLLGADVVIAVYLEADNIEVPRTFTDVLSRSFNIIQRHSDFAWRTQADVIIEPNVKPFVWDDFSKTPEMIAPGEAAALAALPEIRALLRGATRDSAAYSRSPPLAIRSATSSQRLFASY